MSFLRARDPRPLWTALALLVLAFPLLADEPGNVTIKKGTDQIEFFVGKDLVSRYHIGPNVAKPYLWPLNGPGGIPLTRAYPMEKGQPGETTDHVHQKSAWFCHGDVIPEGIELKQKIKGVEGVDFWAEAKGHGVIACTKAAAVLDGRGHGLVQTFNEWRTADGQKILDESRTIHLHDFGNDTRLFIFDIDLHASVVPITFGDTKEGSFGIRINDLLREDRGKGRLENADGKVGEKALWGHISNWCDYSGPLDGRTVGITIFTDPQNPHPTAWHSRGYGLMAANPFGRGKAGFPAPALKGKDLVKLAKGEHLKLRYGILLHPGDAKEGRVSQYYEQFVRMR